MKKYKVSLALKVYSNFEIEIDTDTKEKALKIALEKYSNSEYDENNITEPNWDNSELDIKTDDINDLDSGIYIEEIK
jgi:hypothetical protein